MIIKKLFISLSTQYTVHIGHHILQTSFLSDYCQRLQKRFVIVTDDQVLNFFGRDILQFLQQQGLMVELFSFPAGENYKTRETKQLLEDQLFAKNYGRDTCFIALGGGVVLDLVGFLAATYCRGVPVIYLPTTLLAMVDACIGGKTGVNTSFGKNLIGTLTQPHAVFIDVATLTTLPNHEFHNGMVETIKHGLIADPSLFNYLKQYADKIINREPDELIEIIYANCHIKKSIVEQDENENGLRQLLNFGHTIGHAIEVIENYNLSHGEAVAIGMLVEGYLSTQLGLLEEDVLTTVERVLKHYNLPLKTNAFSDKNRFRQVLCLDKKSRQTIPHFVLLEAIGQPHQFQGSYSLAVDENLLENAMTWAQEKFTPRTQ